MPEITQDAPMAQARASGQTMDVDLWCYNCNHRIYNMFKNVIGSDIPLHSEAPKKISEEVCDKCNSKEGVTIKCYIAHPHDPYAGLRH